MAAFATAGLAHATLCCCGRAVHDIASFNSSRSAILVQSRSTISHARRVSSGMPARIALLWACNALYRKAKARASLMPNLHSPAEAYCIQAGPWKAVWRATLGLILRLFSNRWLMSALSYETSAG